MPHPLALALAAAAALLAVPTPAAAVPCVGGAAYQPTDAVAADARGFGWCTGEACWRLDGTTWVITAVPRPAAVPAAPMIDPRAQLLPEPSAPRELKICPTPDTCRTFSLRITIEPVDPPTVEVNRAGTLAAMRWVGIPERGLPVWARMYNLTTGALVAERRRGGATVLDDAFVIETEILSPTGARLGRLPADFHVVASAPGHSEIALAHRRGKLLIVDAARGTTRHAIALPVKLGGVELERVEARFTPDHRRLYVLLTSPLEGDVWVIDVATGVYLAHARPPVCAAPAK